MDQKAQYRQFLIDFIEMYREFPCLWHVKSVDYRDRTKKNQAYGILVEKYKEMDKNATSQTVKNKIDSLRGAFRKELRKIKESQRSGARADDLYQPHLWYFKNLLFLKRQTTHRDIVSNIDINDTDSSGSQSDDNFLLNDTMYPTSESIDDTVIKNENDLSSVTSPACSSVSQESLAAVNKRRDLKRTAISMADEVLRKVSVQLDSVEDKFDTSAKNIANKLRTLCPETAIVAEKLITDILFEAQMGNVTRFTKVILQDIRSIPQNVQRVMRHNNRVEPRQCRTVAEHEGLKNNDSD